MNSSPRQQHAHLRLVDSTTHSHDAWLARAENDGRAFVARCGHLLSDPSLAPWVIEQCAELIWECRQPTHDWSDLSIEALWTRLESLHRFYPQARLVIAHYETLRAFLPWLCAQGRLRRERGVALLDDLERVRTPMLERAREQLAQRAVYRGRGSR